ncbi:MAG: hypothetical protein Q9202_002164 [Teloschistes flavicans]
MDRTSFGGARHKSSRSAQHHKQSYSFSPPSTSSLTLSALPMGFFSGLFSGFTLTVGTLYLTILLHNRNRTHQALRLHQSALLLHSIVEPGLLPYEDPYPRYRIERGDWTERWKDGWNAEVERAVRGAHSVRWGPVREALEGRWRDWRQGQRRT